MRTVTTDESVLIDRVAGLDLAKAEVVCCVRLPAGQAGYRTQEVTTWSTMTRSLTELANQLVELRVQEIWMEATSDYWRPVFYRLEAHGLRVFLANARQAKHLPGRPKTDVEDAVWLCKLAERGMLRASFVPAEPIRCLRGLTRQRADLVAVRTAQKNRVEKLLEDASIKLSVVASDIFGVSGRAMMEALIAGQRDPVVLAEIARGRMRRKLGPLTEALTGFFNDDHAFRLRLALDLIDQLDADITALEQRIEVALIPYERHIRQLCEVPGIKRLAAATILAEIGPDMTQFPTENHLAAWAKFSPQDKSSAGRPKGHQKSGRGNRYLARILGDVAVAAGKTNTFIGHRHKRLARRRGKLKAVTATGRALLVGIWHLLSDPDAHWIDLGPDWDTRHQNPNKATKSHIEALEQLGYTVTLTPTNTPTNT